jgi:hypothetical protein
MGQIAYRANLSSATFPMTIADGGRTVIVPGPDQNFDRRVDPEGAQRDAGIPQALYMENVMPTTNGYQSVGYIRGITPISAVGLIVGAFPVFVNTGTINVSNTIYETDVGNYSCGTLGNDIVTVAGTALASAVVLSSAKLRGLAYVYSSQGTIYTAAGGTGGITLTEVTASVTPVGFFASSTITAIISFANYLIAVSIDGRVYWSSLTTALDFTASLVSGAGSIIPNDLSGNITAVRLAGTGFYIYSDQNAVYCQYTGNARYPFKFVPVKNCLGVKRTTPLGLTAPVAGSLELEGNIIVESSNIVKYIQRDTSAELSAEISDFLRNIKVQALLDYSTNTLTEQERNTVFPQVYIWLARYVIISINNRSGGITGQYTHALVYDLTTRRMGKLKVSHRFIVESALGLGFVDAVTKELRYLNFDIYSIELPFPSTILEIAQGALLLGKFQYVRSRLMKMEEIEIEGPQNTAIVSSPNFSCVLLPSEDGRNFDTPVPLSPTRISGGLVEYHCHHTAKNHSLLLKGAFSVSTVQLKFVAAGVR